MKRLLITRRVQDWLAGTGAGQHSRFWKPGEPIPVGEDEETMMVAWKVLHQRPTRKDRAVWVELTPGEVETLIMYVDAMRDVGADNTWEPDGRADLSAATALLNKLQ